MRVHTDKLTTADVHAATTAAGMTGVTAKVSEHGSRPRRRALNVYLNGTSSRRPNSASGTYAHDGYAATWDEWGMFLNALFAIDPDAIVGSPGNPDYAGADDFHAVTYDRFRHLTAAYQHGRVGHRWVTALFGSRGTLSLMCATCEAEREHPTATRERRKMGAR